MDLKESTPTHMPANLAAQFRRDRPRWSPRVPSATLAGARLEAELEGRAGGQSWRAELEGRAGGHQLESISQERERCPRRERITRAELAGRESNQPENTRWSTV